MNGGQILDFGTRAIGGIDARDRKYFLDCVNAAAIEFVLETKCHKKTFETRLAAGATKVSLPWDFLELHAKDRNNRLVCMLKAPDGAVTWLRVSTDEIVFTDGPGTGSPSRGHVTQTSTVMPEILLTAAATEKAAGGVALLSLTDPGYAICSHVSIGDDAKNLMDNSSGVVVGTSPVVASIAFFNGEDNDIDAGDEIVISPKPRHLFGFDAAIPEAGWTLVVPYVAKPNPVYSDFGQFPFNEVEGRAIAYYGAYKFLVDYDKDMTADSHLYAEFQRAVSARKHSMAASILQGGRYPYGR